MEKLERTLFEHLEFIYGVEVGKILLHRILKRLDNFRAEHPDLAASGPENRVSERDCILITYGDQVQFEDETPLKTLAATLKNYSKEIISTVHILPFFPYSSDDGFSVIDYFQVNPEFGTWEDISNLGKNFRLMFDAVINHVSSKSIWFQGFIKGDPKYEEYFSIIEPGTDLTKVFRPRATPVLTPFETPTGVKLVWTTFSADQIDLNFANPEVLIEAIDILLFFAVHGADFIRLDAVTFVWKEIGTSCVNSSHTHRIVQTLRTIFDISAPKIAIITETNVPHKDNIAYFGDGSNEAQLVYNFALPILTLNTFHTKDASTLTQWASTLDLPSNQTTFFNFKSNEDGTKSPYELNINYLDALDDPDHPETDVQLLSKRFLATQSIMLALRGVPGIYFHSLFGSRNWIMGVEETGRFRTINREKLSKIFLDADLSDSNSLRFFVYQGFCEMLKVRNSNPVFHPLGGQRILSINNSTFALIRTSCDESTHTLCLVNITNESQNFKVDLSDLPEIKPGKLFDTLNNQVFTSYGPHLDISLAPYQVRWIETYES